MFPALSPLGRLKNLAPAHRARAEARLAAESSARRGERARSESGASGRDAERSARARERGRVKAIVLSDAGKLDPAAAFQVALLTRIPRRAAIAVLDRLRATAADTPASLANLILEAAAKARGEVAIAVPAPTGMAARILDAGRKRRNE